MFELLTAYIAVDFVTSYPNSWKLLVGACPLIQYASLSYLPRYTPYSVADVEGMPGEVINQAYTLPYFVAVSFSTI